MPRGIASFKLPIPQIPFSQGGQFLLSPGGQFDVSPDSCSVAQCATMHGGLPAGTVVTFVPALDRTSHPLALATPDGIGTDPALRPPSLTI